MDYSIPENLDLVSVFDCCAFPVNWTMMRKMCSILRRLVFPNPFLWLKCSIFLWKVVFFKYLLYVYLLGDNEDLLQKSLYDDGSLSSIGILSEMITASDTKNTSIMSVLRTAGRSCKTSNIS